MRKLRTLRKCFIVKKIWKSLRWKFGMVHRGRRSIFRGAQRVDRDGAYRTTACAPSVSRLVHDCILERSERCRHHRNM